MFHFVLLVEWLVLNLIELASYQVENVMYNFIAVKWFFGEIIAERNWWINNEMSKYFFFVLVEVEGPGSVTEKQQVLN